MFTPYCFLPFHCYSHLLITPPATLSLFLSPCFILCILFNFHVHLLFILFVHYNVTTSLICPPFLLFLLSVLVLCLLPQTEGEDDPQSNEGNKESKVNRNKQSKINNGNQAGKQRIRSNESCNNWGVGNESCPVTSVNILKQCMPQLLWTNHESSRDVYTTCSSVW